MGFTVDHQEHHGHITRRLILALLGRRLRLPSDPIAELLRGRQVAQTSVYDRLHRHAQSILGAIHLDLDRRGHLRQ